MIFGGGGGSMGSKEIKYLFIDGACLQMILKHTSERFFDGKSIELDYHELAREFDKVFYYNCLAPQNSDEPREEYEERIQPQVDFFNQLRKIDKYHVFEGITRRRRGVAQQKKVDIMIAVDMLMHSFNRNMHRATLLASDLDFKPLLDALVQAGMHVTL